MNSGRGIGLVFRGEGDTLNSGREIGLLFRREGETLNSLQAEEIGLSYSGEKEIPCIQAEE